ncbi:MAG TPA: response regulator [Acidimicrobiales bacterium]|nr:response regulator [Acidimicrobiales bacterium]
MTEPPGAGLRALVVDDEPPIRALMRTVLELDGWEVLEAEDGAQALALAKAERPHGVVLDVMMPVKDGFDVLAELRRTEHGRAMAVVMLTARSRPSDILRGTRLGADLYVTKPFDPDHVAEQLAFHAHRRSPGARAERPARLRPGRRRRAAPPSA